MGRRQLSIWVRISPHPPYNLSMRTDTERQLRIQRPRLFRGLQRLVVGCGGTTRPLPRDGGAEEFRGDPTVGPHPKVWTIGQE